MPWTTLSQCWQWKLAPVNGPHLRGCQNLRMLQHGLMYQERRVQICTQLLACQLQSIVLCTLLLCTTTMLELTHLYDVRNFKENWIITQTKPLPHGCWMQSAMVSHLVTPALEHTSFPLICCLQSFTQWSLIKSKKECPSLASYTSQPFPTTFTAQV